MTRYRQQLILSIIVLAVFLSYSAASAHASEKKISADLMEKSIASPDSNIRIIVKLKNAPDTKAISAKSGMVKNANTKNFLKNSKALKKAPDGSEIVVAEMQLSELESLASDESVEYIEEDKIMRAFLSESVPLIGANTVWTKQISGENITGAGTSVCIIDTGVDYTHPDLGGCSSAEFLAGSCAKVISGYDFINSDDNPMDDHGHGTHVAGIVAANGTLKGVAPDAKIVAIKVLNSGGGGSESNVIAGINWCVSNSTKFNISAISMSLGGDITYSSYCDTDEQSFRDVIDAAAAKNISVVVATGNNGSLTGYSGISSPACIQNATRVTATNKSDNYALFAERGINFPDILAAPGVDICSARASGTLLGSLCTDSEHILLSGTSMSTPHVSGAIALLSQAYSKIYGTGQTPQYFKNLLNSTGKQIMDTEGTGISFSRINLSAAYGNLTANPITITQPLNGTFTNQNFSDISASQRISGAMWFSVDEGSNISACSLCTSFSNATNNLTDGMHNITVYGNNSAAALNYTTSYFTIDTIAPAIAFENPTDGNNSYANKNWIFANLSINETNFENATFFIFNSSGLINSATLADKSALYTNWTNLGEGAYYFNATAYDRAGNSNSTETRKATVDLNEPIMSSIVVFPPISYPGQNITISYSVSDSSPVNSTINITYGTFSEILNATNSGANYSAIFSNTSAIGEYNITIFANDSASHTSNASAQFRIQPRANVSFNFAANRALVLRIKYNNTEIRNISANSTEEKNASFGSENYTIEAYGASETFTVTLEGVELTDNAVLGISFSNISAATPDSVKYRFTNNSFSFSPNFSRTSATVCFNYTQYAAAFSNLARIANFKCSGMCADGNWSMLETAINTATNRSCSNVSSFSSFVLGETLPYCGDGNIDAGETCSSCAQDAGTCPSTSPTNTGGGGGGLEIIKPKNTTNATKNLTVSKREIVDLEKNITGQNKTRIENNASIPKPNEIKIEGKMSKKENPLAKITGLFAAHFSESFKSAIAYLIKAFLYFSVWV